MLVRNALIQFKKRTLGMATSVHYSIAIPTSSSATTDAKNALRRFIYDKIRASGPITVAEYMKLCISSQQGYYSTKDEIFGEKGDFTTSPELSQIFGELNLTIGAWILNELHMSSWTGEWQLVELGPGSGTLMTDILRVFRKLKSDSELKSVHFVEKSAQLIERQKRAIEKSVENKGISMHWHVIEDIPEKYFTIFISNEFFDALPIHQFVRSSTNPKIWHEIYVNLAEQNQQHQNNNEKEQKFSFMLSPGETINTQAFVPQHIRQDPGRTHWEYCPAAKQITSEMVRRFTSNGGFALIMDYGHDGKRKEHSLRAYKGHKLVNPLETPGEVDLTADVDFGELARAVEGKCLAYGPVEQRHFLSELGLGHRANYLMEKCKNKEQREALLAACKMLISEEGMGVRFKAFSLFPTTLAEIIDARGGIPAGFASTLPGIRSDGRGTNGNDVG